jgi:hypothetical protein
MADSLMKRKITGAEAMKAIRTLLFTMILAVPLFSCGDKSGADVIPAGDVFSAIRANDMQKAGDAFRGLKDPDIRNAEGRTPLLEAIELGRSDMAGLFIRLGAPVDSRDAGGVAPLLLSVKKRNLILVKLLLDARADVNAADESGLNPVRAAVGNRQSDTEIVNLLVKAGADKSLVTDMPGGKQTIIQTQKTVVREVVPEKAWADFKEQIKAELTAGAANGQQIRDLESYMEESRQALSLIKERLSGIEDQLKAGAANQPDVKGLSDIIDDMEQSEKKE